MTLSVDEKKLCDQLTHIMKHIDDLMVALGEIPSNYKGFVKIKNIAENNDKNGFRNISFYLDNDARMLYDNRAYSDKLDVELEKVYSISDQLNN